MVRVISVVCKEVSEIQNAQHPRQDLVDRV